MLPMCVCVFFVAYMKKEDDNFIKIPFNQDTAAVIFKNLYSQRKYSDL